MNVRLTFRGADIGEYPNGTPFSAAEIISPVILTKVYRQNGLEPERSPVGRDDSGQPPAAGSDAGTTPEERKMRDTPGT